MEGRLGAEESKSTSVPQVSERWEVESYLAGPLTVNYFEISLSWTAAPNLQASALVEREWERSGAGKSGRHEHHAPRPTRVGGDAGKSSRGQLRGIRLAGCLIFGGERRAPWEGRDRWCRVVWLVSGI